MFGTRGFIFTSTTPFYLLDCLYWSM